MLTNKNKIINKCINFICSSYHPTVTRRRRCHDLKNVKFKIHKRKVIISRVTKLPSRRKNRMEYAKAIKSDFLPQNK